MARALEIAIVGYGIAGIAAAIRLGKLGHRITRFERRPAPVTEGAGMLLHPAGQRQLRQLGVLEEAMDRGERVNRIRALNEAGAEILHVRYADHFPTDAGLGIGRAALHGILAGADEGHDQVHWNHEITSIDARNEVLGVPSGAHHGPFDLVVIADGAHSRLRGLVPFATRCDRISESGALVGWLEDPGREAGDELVQYFQGSRHVSLWPIGLAEAAKSRSCAFAMNVSIAEAAVPRDDGRWLGIAADICPPLRRLISRTGEAPQVTLYAFRDSELRVLSNAKAVVVGDAGHGMSPQLGNGAQLALEDAEALAYCVSRCVSTDAALRSYSERRLPRLQRLHEASRRLTPFFQSDSRSLAMLRDGLLAHASRGPFSRLIARQLLE